MIPAFQHVVFATNRPLRMLRLQGVLRAAGMDCEPLVMSPRQWCDTPEAQNSCLVFLDARSAPSWQSMALARRRASNSRFVVCSPVVTPELVRSAMECGMDGVLSTRLTLEDAARALRQICRGERQFRFQPAAVRPSTPLPAPAPPDFDTLWMFGTQGV